MMYPQRGRTGLEPKAHSLGAELPAITWGGGGGAVKVLEFYQHLFRIKGERGGRLLQSTHFQPVLLHPASPEWVSSPREQRTRRSCCRRSPGGKQTTISI